MNFLQLFKSIGGFFSSNVNAILVVIIYSTGIASGVIATRIVYLSIIDEMKLSQAEEDLAKARVVEDMLVAQAQDLEAQLIRQRKAEEDNRNANIIIDNLMRDADKRSGLRVVSIKGVCASAMPEVGSQENTDSTTSDVLEGWDRGYTEFRDSLLGRLTACERDRESVIEQAGGR